jgi:hypothetical protein
MIYFIIGSIAWLVIGGLCCGFMHPDVCTRRLDPEEVIIYLFCWPYFVWEKLVKIWEDS